MSQTQFTTVRTEGGLLPPDLLARIAANNDELAGLKPDDYGLAKGERLNEVIARSWERVKAYWTAFRAARDGLATGDSGVTETREQWLLPLFRELGYGRLGFRPAAAEIEGRRYPISHQTADGAVPLHLVSFRQALDKSSHEIAATSVSSASGASGRTSPHALLQEYLNRTPYLWGIVSNGLALRLLRDNLKLSRPAYVEFDLEAMLDGGVYADFVLLYLTVHRSRLPQPLPGQAPQPADACWLERWRIAAEERGARALDELRGGVEIAIRALGQGFIAHPANGALRAALSGSTLNAQLSTLDFYRQLLRLVYRFLFLLAAEDRDLLFEREADPRRKEIYLSNYGIGRLRELVAARRHADRYDDLWRSLQITFSALRLPEPAAKLGLKPLAGGLFGGEVCRDLEDALISNDKLLDAIRGLTFTTTNGIVRRTNYRDMDVEELGSVYESLLESQPHLDTTSARPTFDLGHSGERKSTGSYYTNPGLVQELVRSALDPVIAAITGQRLPPEEKRRRLLELKICDPACGSGHFLLAAARRIGRELARLAAGESEPDPETARHATREAIARCVYGADLNPLAVDLCKLALWLEAHEPGKPIGFLDHHIREGNSLVGVSDLDLLDGGIPDGAFTPVTGDDKRLASDIKRRNKQERAGQLDLFAPGEERDILAGLMRVMNEITAMAEDTAAEVAAKEQAYKRLRMRDDFHELTLACNLWTWAFFAPKRRDAGADRVFVPTTSVVRRLLARGLRNLQDDRRLFAKAEAAAIGLRFFHWPLAFVDVFARPDAGFDCILGNPPWDQVQLDPREFFHHSAPEISNQPNMAARDRVIAKLKESDSALYGTYLDALHSMEALQNYIHTSSRFPKTSYGRLNTAPLFAEFVCGLIRRSGKGGIIVPSGIATDSFNQYFFQWLVSEGQLASLYDFENREGLFPAVDSRMKFSLLGLAGQGRQNTDFDVAFFLTQPSQLREPGRRFSLSADDLALLNPNTKTCPIFRTARDAELTKVIYHAAPVLVDEAAGDAGNPWGIRFKLMFMMNSDSHLFRTRQELEATGGVLGPDGRFRTALTPQPPLPILGEGEPFSRTLAQNWERVAPQAPGEGVPSLPLYEAKLIHQFDHRFATYTATGDTPNVTAAEHADPDFVITPRYWVDEREVTRAAGTDKQWFLGFRDIARNTDERTAIFSLVPWAGIGNSLPIFDMQQARSDHVCGLLANTTSFVFDFAARQKAGGTHLNFFIVKQLPVLPSETYTPVLLEMIVPRVLELVYTADDLTPFARDCGYAGPPFGWDEARRARLRAELDGIYAHLYGLGRDDFAYILDQFPIVRRNDEKACGEFRTKRLCLAAYDEFSPAALQNLEQEIKRIERGLRGIIAAALTGSAAALPPELREKLTAHYANFRPAAATANGDIPLSELLQAAYLLDLVRILRAGGIWEQFAERCGSKRRLDSAFAALNETRNALAHNRDLPEATRRQGEEAARWLRQVFALA